MAVTAVGRALRIPGAAVPAGDLKAAPDPVLELSRHDRVAEVTRVAEPAEPPSGADADDAEDEPDALSELVLEASGDGGEEELELGLFS